MFPGIWSGALCIQHSNSAVRRGVRAWYASTQLTRPRCRPKSGIDLLGRRSN
jgi:hypothetical protein